MLTAILILASLVIAVVASLCTGAKEADKAMDRAIKRQYEEEL